MEIVNKVFSKVAELHNKAVSTLQEKLGLNEIASVGVVLIVEIVLLNLVIQVLT